MKFFKKINIGLVLTVITILCVVIYCVKLENSRKSAKQDIKNVCEEFIDVTDKYSELPEEYQKVGENLTKVNLDNYYTEIENVLKDKMKNDASAKIQKTVMTDNLQDQLYDSSKIIVDYNREITKISSYEFDGNEVTVTFNSKITIKQKYIEENEETLETSEKISEKSFNSEDESIVLEKIDGNWKIVCANLQFLEGSELIG